MLVPVGYWGPVTATLDWCEANYLYTPYIAEVANTFSNLFTIAIALYGAVHSANNLLPSRYVLGFLGIALVGVGSFLFHATLLYSAQLADELPMIYSTSWSIFILFDLNSSHKSYVIPIIVAFDLLFSIAYILYRNPVFHQVVFGTLLFITVIRTHYLLPSYRIPYLMPLYQLGILLFSTGFVIWNLDNIFCDTITEWKIALGPMAWLLEGHAWWHVLTAAGSYLLMIGNHHLTLTITHPQQFALMFKYGFLPVIDKLPDQKAVKTE